MSIFHMIDTIRTRPGMYLGSNSISALRNFLDGYQAAEREYGIQRAGELFPLPFRYMHEYAGYRLQHSSTMGWRLMILDACDGAEDAALQKFFELCDEFRQIRMKRYWKAVLSEDNIAWNEQMKGAYRCTNPNDLGDPVAREPVFRDPQAVYVIELTISACILAVETAGDIRLVPGFFASPEKAKGGGMFPEGAEIYFGPIDPWEEFAAAVISFDKNIVI